MHAGNCTTLLIFCGAVLCMQEDCTRVLMFRGADREVKNSTGHTAYQVAVAASYHNLADAIQKFKPDDVGKNLAVTNYWPCAARHS